jgi:hypothetical protein
MATDEQRIRRATIITDDGCWIWTRALDASGYGRVGKNGKVVGAHRLAWMTYVGPIPAGAHVLHRDECSSRACCNPDHLYLGSHQQNMRDRDGWGHGIRGERVATARLTEAMVMEAKSLRGDGLTWKQIASRYGVSTSAVRHAVTGRNWKHLPN